MSKLIVIVGPTASGKTALAATLCRKFNGEIISADSRQVYRGMNIGTGKEHFTDLPQHLIDICDPKKERFNVYQFQKLAQKKIKEIWQKEKIPFVVGGTGLYVSALIKGYVFSKIKNQKSKIKNQPNHQFLILGIEMPRQELYRRIDARVDKRIKEGMIKEVQNLLKSGVPAEKLISFGLEYKFITQYLIGEIKDSEEMVSKLKFATHAFARRQLTWLRHQLNGINWIKNKNQAEKLVEKFLV